MKYYMRNPNLINIDQEEKENYHATFRTENRN